VGTGEIKPAVTDSGPLIHLSEISQLQILTMFPAIYIPDAVWEETVSKGRIDSNSLQPLSNVHRQSFPGNKIQKFAKAHGITSLDAGEKACLALCKHLNCSLLLTDDLAARKHAKRLKITPVGSLGIIVKAYAQDIIRKDKAENLLWKLHDVTSLYVTPAIVELAIGKIRELSRD